MSDTSALPAARPGRIEAILAFLAIYVIWGSTFLAIRYAVESIPPLFTAATRHLVAGSILLAWALWKGERPTRQGWRAGIILGFLFFFVSHGLLHWAELSVPSGVAALVIAIEPAIVALLLPLLKLGPRPRGITWAGLALGAASVALLFRPDVSAAPEALTGLLAVLVSAIAWSIGIVYSRKLQPPDGSTLNAALPLLCGSLMLLAGGLLRGEHHALQLSHVLPESLVGLLFLIFFGSLTAFSRLCMVAEALPTDPGRNPHVRQPDRGSAAGMGGRWRKAHRLDPVVDGAGHPGDLVGEPRGERPAHQSRPRLHGRTGRLRCISTAGPSGVTSSRTRRKPAFS